MDLTGLLCLWAPCAARLGLVLGTVGDFLLEILLSVPFPLISWGN